MLVVVAMQDQFRAMLGQNLGQGGRVDQRLVAACKSGQGRVVDHDDTGIATLAEIIQQDGKRFNLGGAEKARGAVQRLRHGGCEADQRDIAAQAYIGKGRGDLRAGEGEFSPACRRHEVGEVAKPVLPVAAHIGIVVAGNKADPAGFPKSLEPVGGGGKFSACRHIHDVAGEGYVVGSGLDDVLGDGMGDGGIMVLVTAEAPVQDTNRAFQCEVMPGGTFGHRTEMQIGEMSETEHVALFPLVIRELAGGMNRLLRLSDGKIQASSMGWRYPRPVR